MRGGSISVPCELTTGRQSDERYSTMAVTTGTTKSEATSRNWRRPRRLRVVGWAHGDSPDLRKLRTNQIATASAAKANHCTA